MDRPTQDVLGQLREALVYRADAAKRLSDALRDSSAAQAGRDRYLRARAARVAYYEAVKLIDEAISTGAVREFASGGSDGLLDAMRSRNPAAFDFADRHDVDSGGNCRAPGCGYYADAELSGDTERSVHRDV